jgi:ribonuclease VapC
MVLAAKLDITPRLAEARYELLLREAEMVEVAMPPMIGPVAVGAFLRFGKGRHPARLNFADCLAYACARGFGARLLFKGDNFSKTDVNDFV